MREYGNTCCDLQGRQVYFSTLSLEHKQMQAGTKEGSLVLCEEYTGVEEMTTRQIFA